MVTPIALKALAVAISLLAAPYVDPEGRFSLELPPGWQLTPVPESGHDIAFSRQAGDALALGSVRVVGGLGHTDLVAFARTTLKSWQRQQGFNLAAREGCKLAGQRGMRRRFVLVVQGAKRPAGQSPMTRMVEQRLLVMAGRGYVVHVESLAESFPRFAADFEKIFGSFRVGKQVSAPRSTSVPQSLELLEGPYLGQWQMSGAQEVRLLLRADGTFNFAGQEGVFQVQGRTLVLNPRGGVQEAFSWRIVEGKLLLGSPAFQKPHVYVRVRAGKNR